MPLSLAISLIILSSVVSYLIGGVRGIDRYHEHLLRENKIHYK